MAKISYGQRGYVGTSISVRAAEQYEAGKDRSLTSLKSFNPVRA